MKLKIQEIFSKEPSAFWKQQFKGTDACVTKVYNELKSIKKKVFRDTIVAKEEQGDKVWGKLKEELMLRDGVTLVPLARL